MQNLRDLNFGGSKVTVNLVCQGLHLHPPQGICEVLVSQCAAVAPSGEHQLSIAISARVVSVKINVSSFNEAQLGSDQGPLVFIAAETTTPVVIVFLRNLHIHEQIKKEAGKTN